MDDAAIILSNDFSDSSYELNSNPALKMTAIAQRAALAWA